MPYRPLGELAGDVLVRSLEGEPPAPSPELPAALAVRASTGPPAPAS